MKPIYLTVLLAIGCDAFHPATVQERDVIANAMISAAEMRDPQTSMEKLVKQTGTTMTTPRDCRPAIEMVTLPEGVAERRSVDCAWRDGWLKATGVLVGDHATLYGQYTSAEVDAEVRGDLVIRADLLHGVIEARGTGQGLVAQVTTDYQNIILDGDRCAVGGGLTILRHAEGANVDYSDGLEALFGPACGEIAVTRR